ncbi:Ubiquitin carboxyl-terminal hydrolase isozyme L3 [Histomonas meleagridis]|uniref:Ubiquitin carboxyl-terminal hydrolase isozyme L3 n=1 Tax=Histomonas meleagridis TaxID=135588 RepID=UPI00355A8072|nr:Ubiquitin carboxyl-terminal hydrolase isozyme L3 [Histomonas meleagridis]KAH0797131.1 Ubiquitin carboxyl-terminal hydrolase isozyme L3 [Histomonas meleagridis]
MSEEGVLTALSNDPESLTDFAIEIGLDESCFQFSEIFSFEPEMLEFIPQPVFSVIFLYPVGEEDGPLETRFMEEREIQPDDPWFTIQTLPNACGTIAVIHSIANNLDKLKIVEGSWLAKFFEVAKSMSPAQRADYIEGNEEIQDLHEDAATEDTTPIIEEYDMNHFITFIQKDGKLWELDGRKPAPICHGKCTNLMNDALNVIQTQFMPNVPDPMRTSTTVLTHS